MIDITFIGRVHREKHTFIFNFYPNYCQDLSTFSIDLVTNRLVTWDNSANGFIVKWNTNLTQEGIENQIYESSNGMKGNDWKCFSCYCYHSLRMCSFEGMQFIFEVIFQSFPLRFVL